MIIEKISNDPFTFVKEGNDYILYMNSISRRTPRPFTIKIWGVVDSGKVSVRSTCGCSTAEKTIVDKTTLTAKISYNDCDAGFTKTIVISDNGRNTNLKIKGSCLN